MPLQVHHSTTSVENRPNKLEGVDDKKKKKKTQPNMAQNGKQFHHHNTNRQVHTAVIGGWKAEC